MAQTGSDVLSNKGFTPQPEDKDETTPNPLGGVGNSADAWTELLKNRQSELDQLRQEGKELYSQAAKAAEPTPAVQESRAALGQEAERQTREKPAVPTEEALPEKPDMVRPFGTGKDVATSLSGVVQSLGLLIAMGVGNSRGYAQGALAAYSGAMQGWAKGDSVRAEREWKRYLQQVNEANDHWKKGMEKREALLRDNKDTLDQLKLRLAINEAEMGSKKEVVQMMLKDHEQAMKMFELEGKEIEKIMKANQDLFFKAMAANNQAEGLRLRAEAQKSVEKYRDRRLKSDADGRQVARDIMLQDKQMKQYVTQFEKEQQFTENFNTIEKAYRNLQKRSPDLLPQNGEAVEAWSARVSRFLEPGNRDVAVITQFWNPTMIGGWDRGMNDEKGARALQVYQSQLEGHTLFSFDSFHHLSATMRQLIKKRQQDQLDVMKTLQIQPSVMAAAMMWVAKTQDPFDAMREDAEQEKTDSMVDYSK